MRKEWGNDSRFTIAYRWIPPFNVHRRYASEVDVDFVRKSVRAIGQCAVKIDETSERCINVLLDLINTKVNYVVQEAIVVIKVNVVWKQSPENILCLFAYYACRIIT